MALGRAGLDLRQVQPLGRERLEDADERARLVPHREEDRGLVPPGGPHGPPPDDEEPGGVVGAVLDPRPEDRILHVAAFRDPVHEMDKLTELYESLAEARREVGEQAVPFHKFADLVKTQVKKLNEESDAEVAFRVAIKDGKVSLTARAMRGIGE